MPAFPYSGHLTTEELRGYVASAFPAALIARRWFGDKSRTIRSVELVDTVSTDRIDSLLAIVDVHFAAGESARYLVPVVVAASGSGAEYCALLGDSQTSVLEEGLLDEQLRRWLLEVTLSGQSWQTGTGATLTGESDARWLPADVAGTSSRVLGFEQSNSSLVYGDRVLFKLFRRLQPGQHPDVELVRFLSGKAGFENVPRFAGALIYRDRAGQTTVLGVAQEFVHASGDGWNVVLAKLRELVRTGDDGVLIEDARSLGATLGTTTARMHLALSSDPWSTDLAPEVITETDVAQWSDDYLHMLDRMLEGLRAYSAFAGDERTSALVDATIQLAPGLHRRTTGFRALAGRTKTRVHGDYHLGQTLRREDGDFVVLDFEGEPARTLAERRAKTSPLKDVAGMLRSFGYARGTLTAELDAASPLGSAALVQWERQARTSFIEAYAESARAGGGRFPPERAAELESAIAAWELDKATYEVVYELNNRPSWLWIPLSAMVKHGEPDQPVEP